MKIYLKDYLQLIYYLLLFFIYFFLIFIKFHSEIPFCVYVSKFDLSIATLYRDLSEKTSCQTVTEQHEPPSECPKIPLEKLEKYLEPWRSPNLYSAFIIRRLHSIL